MSITTSTLKYSYDEAQALRFPDISLENNDALLILGSSGKGKTTFLHLLAGLLRPSSGEIEINQTSLNNLSSKQLDQFRGKHIGLIFQKTYFVKALTIKENLILAQRLSGQEANTKEINQVLEDLAIAYKVNDLPSQLSIGEQQRASIARATLIKPAVILADEPTSALDDENAVKVADLLESTARSCDANLVIVTHDTRLKNRFSNSIEL